MDPSVAPDNHPLWLGVLGAVLPLIVTLLTGAAAAIGKRSFRASLKADAELLKALPDDSPVRQQLLVSVEERIAHTLRKPERQTRQILAIRRWSGIGVTLSALIPVLTFGVLYWILDTSRLPVQPNAEERASLIFQLCPWLNYLSVSAAVFGSVSACAFLVAAEMIRFREIKTQLAV